MHQAKGVDDAQTEGRPMTRPEYLEQQMRDCAGWFKDHVPCVTVGPTGCVIRWAKPGTSTYWCDYILHGRFLIVVGDIGEAVYEWSEKVTPQFLRGINFDYMMGKCQASNTGRRDMQWSEEVAACSAKMQAEGESDDRLKDRLQTIVEHRGDKEVCEEEASEIYERTGDAEYAYMVSSFGSVPSAQSVGHFVGLKMALEKINI